MEQYILSMLQYNERRFGFRKPRLTENLNLIENIKINNYPLQCLYDSSYHILIDKKKQVHA